MIWKFFPTGAHFAYWFGIICGAFGFAYEGHTGFATGLLLGTGMTWVFIITDDP